MTYIRLATLLILSSLLVGHSELHGQQPPAVKPPKEPPQTSASDRIQNMRADLNQMESLMNNMTSEINFLRDQNLQILLNTNVRMWTILIRDLRLQLDEEEQKRSLESKPAKPKAPQR